MKKSLNEEEITKIVNEFLEFVILFLNKFPITSKIKLLKQI